MTRTIIKTGAVLRLILAPGVKQEIYSCARGSEEFGTLYGDFHVVGSAGIMYFPSQQVGWGDRLHGMIEIQSYEFGSMFVRGGDPFGVLVLPIKCFTIFKDQLHHLDEAEFIKAGGKVV